MQYIVLDLEWNQPWPGSYSAKKVLPSPIRGEIVQIGAVRMSCEGTVADEFQMLIRPAYYKKMNRKVASLTGIKDAILKEQGKPFPEAMQAFHDWCGEDRAFLTWGFDDIVILKENLQYAFPDFGPWLGRCQFHDCSHRREPGCAVRAAAEEGRIEPSRYDSYLRLYEKAALYKEWEHK